MVSCKIQLFLLPKYIYIGYKFNVKKQRQNLSYHFWKHPSQTVPSFRIFLFFEIKGKKCSVFEWMPPCALATSTCFSLIKVSDKDRCRQKEKISFVLSFIHCETCAFIGFINMLKNDRICSIHYSRLMRFADSQFNNRLYQYLYLCNAMPNA